MISTICRHDIFAHMYSILNLFASKNFSESFQIFSFTVFHWTSSSSSTFIPLGQSIHCDCVEIILSNDIIPIVAVSAWNLLAGIILFNYNWNCVPNSQSLNIQNLLQTMDAVPRHFTELQNTVINEIQYWEIFRRGLSKLIEIVIHLNFEVRLP